MSRKPRIHYPGALYHVMLRGNGGNAVFACDQDRYRFYLLLQQAIERYCCRVFAFCLMDNHVHLAVQVGDIPLSRFMQNLSGRYTRWFNWRTKKTGHLFQGRYKAIVVEEDSYLLQLVAYLHLNPVRAGMVQAPEDYRWSSHRAYLGRETIPWLSCEVVLSQLSAKVSAARRQFSEFVAGEAGKGHRKEFHGAGSKDSRIFGEDQFLLDVLSRADQLPVTPPDLPTVVELVTDFFGCGISELKSPSQSRHHSSLRAMLAWAVAEFSDATLTELGTLLSRDVSTLSSAVRRLKVRALQDNRVAEAMATLKAKLANLQSRPQG